MAEQDEPLKLRQSAAEYELRGREDDEIIYARRTRALPWIVLPITLLTVSVQLVGWSLLGGAQLLTVLGTGLMGGALLGLVAEASRWFTQRVVVRVRKGDWSWRRGGETEWRAGDAPLRWVEGWLMLGDKRLGWVGLRGHVEDVVRAVKAVDEGAARPLIARRALVGFNRELDESTTVDHVEARLQPRFGDHAFLPWVRSMLPWMAFLGFVVWLPLVWSFDPTPAGLTRALLGGPIAVGMATFVLLYVAEMLVGAGIVRPETHRVRITQTHLEVDGERWALTDLRLSYQHHDDASVLRVRTSDDAPWRVALRARIWELRPLITSLEDAVAHAQAWSAPMEREERSAVEKLMGGVKKEESAG